MGEPIFELLFGDGLFGGFDGDGFFDLEAVALQRANDDAITGFEIQFADNLSGNGDDQAVAGRENGLSIHVRKMLVQRVGFVKES